MPPLCVFPTQVFHAYRPYDIGPEKSFSFVQVLFALLASHPPVVTFGGVAGDHALRLPWSYTSHFLASFLSVVFVAYRCTYTCVVAAVLLTPCPFHYPSPQEPTVLRIASSRNSSEP
jgi:hypothetical protein